MFRAGILLCIVVIGVRSVTGQTVGNVTTDACWKYFVDESGKKIQRIYSPVAKTQATFSSRFIYCQEFQEHYNDYSLAPKRLLSRRACGALIHCCKPVDRVRRKTTKLVPNLMGKKSLCHLLLKSQAVFVPRSGAGNSMNGLMYYCTEVQIHKHRPSDISETNLPVKAGDKLLQANNDHAFSPPNRLDFTCDDGYGTMTINANGLDPNAFIIATGIRVSAFYWQEFEAECTVTEKSSAGSRLFEISGCILNREIAIYIMKGPNPGHEDVGTTTHYNKEIIGGQGVATYILECFKERVDDVSKLAPSIELNKTARVESRTAPKEVEYNVYVDMTVWKNDTPINPTTYIVVGDPLLIVISGPVHPKYYVKTCTAYVVDHPDIYRNIFDNGKVTDDMMMTGFDQDFNNLTHLEANCYGLFCVKATLYAFHFPLMNNIALECTIEVCNNYNGICKKDKSFTANPFIYRTTRPVWTNPLIGPPRGRWPRDSSPEIHLLRSRFVVRDELDSKEFQQISDGNTSQISYYMTGALAILWVSVGFDWIKKAMME